MFLVSEAPPDVEALRRAVERPDCGAVVFFCGTVRDHTADRRVTRLEYEAYASMAEAQMEQIGREVEERFGLSAIAGQHRVGRLEIGDLVVAVAASAPHREAAFRGVEAFIQRLKEDVPIWKQEHFVGGAVWVGSPEDPQGRTVEPEALEP